MDVDEEGVEPPVHNKESDGDLVAADDLNVFPRVPRHQADIQQTAAREGSVESWRISELDGWMDSVKVSPSPVTMKRKKMFWLKILPRLLLEASL